MSLVLNMVGGGGGLSATDALLRVQATAGSTVTITKGTTTKTDQGHENADDNTKYDYYFIIHQSQFDSVNPWTVTATLGSLASVDTIIISAPDEYDMELTPLVGIDYQAVEYIQSSGTQCLVTPGILMDSYSSSNKYLISCSYRPVTSLSGTKYVFGIEDATTPQFGPVYIMQGSTDRVFIGSIDARNVSASSANTDYALEFLMESSALTVTRNNTVLLNNQSFGNSIAVGRPCGIITCYWHGSILTNSTYLPSLRLYYFKYSVNDTLVYDMIPCYRKSDSVAGMFDRISNTFCTNQGSGSFVVGADV